MAGEVNAAASRSRLERLRHATSSVQKHIIPLHTKISKYAYPTQRDYGLFVLFTAKNPKYRCVACNAAEANLKVAAESIREGLSWDSIGETGNATETYLNHANVFFAVVGKSFA